MTVDSASEDMGADDWNEAFADKLLGSYVLVGIAYRDASGEIVERAQVHGYIRSVVRDVGITVRLEGEREGEVFKLPDLLDAFEPAELGVYESEAGEIITDPDFVAYFTVTKPKQ